MKRLNTEVTDFLDALNHPLREEIDALRVMILNGSTRLTENIKWNGPNYGVDDQDRITMKIQPPKQIQLIFHRGAKKLAQPKSKLFDDESKILVWKENDRAVASFKSMDEIKKAEPSLKTIINRWIIAAS